MSSISKTYCKGTSALHVMKNAENILLQCHLIEGLHYDQALQFTGQGKMNIIVLMVCSLSLLAVGLQNGITAYLLPLAKCDLQLSNEQIGFINIAFMIGGISSACLWGIVSDVIGIRKILMITFLCDGVTCVLSSLSQSFITLLFCRFFNGFFVGGPGCLTFIYLSDFTSPSLRSKYTCCIGLCFILSWIMLPSLSLAVRQLHETYYIFNSITINSWKLYLLILSLPSLTCALFFYNLPESPKLLLQNNNIQEGVIVLRSMFTVNTGKAGKLYLMEMIKDIKCSTMIEINKIKYNISTKAQLKRISMQVLKQTTQLFSKHFLIKTCILSCIFYINMFGCYGFGLWIPEMLTKINDRNLTESKIHVNVTLHTSMCDGGSNVTYKWLYGTMTIGVCCLIYNLMNNFMSQYMKKQGVHILPSVSLCVGGLSGLVMLAPYPCVYLPAISLFQSTMTTANILIVSLTIDAYPTSLRNMAVCIVTMFGRVGSICSNILFGSNMDSHYTIPIVVVSLLAIGASILVQCVTLDTSRQDKESNNTNENDIDLHI